MKRQNRFAIAAAALALGCDGITRACTLIGCDNALVVKFDRPAAFPYRVEVENIGNSAKQVIDCASATQCIATEARFIDYLPQVTRITVTTPTGTTTVVAEPAYTARRPNGSGCEPTCITGTVTVTIP